MKPTTLHYFFASNWTWRIWFTAIPAMSAFIIGRICATFLDPLSAWRDLIQFAFFVFIALLLGFFLAMLLAVFPGWFIIGPVARHRELENGGPFKVGDMVRILSGRYQGRVSRVYSTWQGNTFRVDLGPEAKNKFRDIFAGSEVKREERAEPEMGEGPPLLHRD